MCVYMYGETRSRASLWSGQVTPSCVCIRMSLSSCFLCAKCTRGRSVNQPPIEMIAHSTGVWLSSLCCQPFGGIVLLAACLFEQWPVCHSGLHGCPAIPTHTHTNCTHTNICCATAGTWLPEWWWWWLGGGGGPSVCLFVHLEVVCFVKHHCHRPVTEDSVMSKERPSQEPSLSRMLLHIWAASIRGARKAQTSTKTNGTSYEKTQILSKRPECTLKCNPPTGHWSCFSKNIHGWKGNTDGDNDHQGHLPRWSSS